MRSATVLRLCLVLEWVFFLVGLGLSFAMEQFLPEPLRAWLNAEAERDLTTADITLIVVAAPLLVASIVSTVGLFFLQRWAAWLCLIMAILGVVLIPFLGPIVEHPVPGTMQEYATFFAGMVIALAFFSDALKKQPAALSTPRDVAEAAPGVS